MQNGNCYSYQHINGNGYYENGKNNTNNDWDLNSYKNKPIRQQPNYLNKERLNLQLTKVY